jgi:hypothetical protein
MDRLLALVILGGVALGVPVTSAQAAQIANPRPDLESSHPSGDLDAMPPAPSGKSTILGGAIRNLDPVRDQFSLQVYGQRAVKILFDERTEVYRDGARIPLRDLRPEDHASVQTILDGTNVFALSIHILSRSPEGDCQGRVLHYSPGTGELTVRSDQSAEPVRMIVSANTTVMREGESAFTSEASGVSDLVAGTLISATFRPEAGGRAIASHITVLAVPGSSFIFGGSISFLDVHLGLLELVDPRDGKSYQIHFDSARTPASENLHLGENVTIKARYDGSGYEAGEITVN